MQHTKSVVPVPKIKGKILIFIADVGLHLVSFRSALFQGFTKLTLEVTLSSSGIAGLTTVLYAFPFILADILSNIKPDTSLYPLKSPLFWCCSGLLILRT